MRGAWFKFHFVHEILDTDLVQNAVRVDEQDEEVVIAFEIFRVDFVNELEGGLLAFPLSSMSKS